MDEFAQPTTPYTDERTSKPDQWRDGGTAIMARDAGIAQAKAYADKARAILTDKGQSAGFAIDSTAVGALLLGFEALLSAWEGGPPGDANVTVEGKT